MAVPIGAGLAFLGGGDSGVALLVGASLTARVLPTVLVVRSYLGNTADSSALRWPALLVSAAAPALMYAVARDWLLVAPLLVLAGRAVLALGFRRYVRRPKQIGLLEAAYGAVAVACWALAIHPD